MGIWTLTTAVIPCLSFNKRPVSPLDTGAGIGGTWGVLRASSSWQSGTASVLPNRLLRELHV